VTSDTRMDAVISGKVDLECGSTTSNLERQKSVAFSPIIYVAGTKIMVQRGSGIGSYRDLGGKTLVVTSGTTNEAAMKLLKRQNTSSASPSSRRATTRILRSPGARKGRCLRHG